jgi:glycosyltransferase involved in cell wall biosynthesis
MRIVLVGAAYPFRGGIAHHTALLFQELSKRHDVCIITFKRQYPGLLFPGKTQLESEGELVRAPADQLIDSVNPLNWIRVGRRIQRMRPDLLIFRYWLPFFGPCFGTIARIAKRNRHTRVMYLCDNIIPHERRPGDRAFTRYAFAPAEFFIVQSTIVERDLLSIRPDASFRKVPHPVYSIFGDRIDKHDARRALGFTHERCILFFGYVRPYKGLHVLIDAMADIVRRAAVHLVVVGEFYDGEQAYREQVTRLHLEDHVTFRADYVPNQTVAQYFSAADAVILPYLSATQSGIVQIAYNFDKPVITTNVGGLGEVVLDGVTGFLVPPGDAAALADRIVRFYDEGKEDVFRRNIQQEKKKYSWEALAGAIEELATG